MNLKKRKTEKALDKEAETAYNSPAKQSRYGIAHLTPAQSVTGGQERVPESEGVFLRGCCTSALFRIQNPNPSGGVFHRNHDPRNQRTDPRPAGQTDLR